MLFDPKILHSTHLTSNQSSSTLYRNGAEDGCIFVWPHIFDAHKDALKFVADAYLFCCVTDKHPRFPKDELHLSFSGTFEHLEPEELYDIRILEKIVFAELKQYEKLRMNEGVMIDKEEYHSNPEKYRLLSECVLVTPVYEPHRLEIMSVRQWFSLSEEDRELVYDLLGTCYEVDIVTEEIDDYPG